MLNRRRKEKYLVDIKRRDAKALSLCNIDLSGMTLEGFDLSNIDFSRGLFKKTRFIKCVIMNSCFRGAVFCGALFEDCIIRAVNMEFANLKGAGILRSSINDVDMRNLSAERIRINTVEAISVCAEGSNFSGSIIENSKFDKVKSRGCLFRDAVLFGSLFSDVDFSASDFVNGVWKKNKFIGVSFDAVITTGLDIRKTYFERMSLFKADFSSANGITKDFRKLIVTQGGLDSRKYSRTNNAAVVIIVLILAGVLYFNHILSIDAILARINRLESAGQLKKAEGIIKYKLSHSKGLSQEIFAQLNLALARIYYRSGRPDEARKLYEEVAGMSNEWYSLEAYGGLTMISRGKGEHLEAIKIYNKLLSIIPEGDGWRRHYARLELGDTNLDMGNSEEALKIYEEEVKKGSGLGIKAVIESKLRIISLLERRNKRDEVLRLCNELLSMEGLERQQRGELLLRKANMLNMAGRPDEARKLYEEVAAARYF